jgi:lysophospholipase L1-like esterase
MISRDYRIGRQVMPFKRSIARKVSYSLAVFVGFFGLVEGSLRAFNVCPLERARDGVTNWQSSPLWDGEFYVFPPGDDINSDGLRDREHESLNPDGVHRVVFLGDSVTYGWPIHRKHNYPSQLARLLIADGCEVEIFNVALPGWTTRQQLIAYRRIVRKYEPHHVILGVCLNDIPEMQNNLAKPSSALTAAFRHSHLVRWVMRPHAWEIKRVNELFDRIPSPLVVSAWELFFREIRELEKEVRSDGAQLSVVVFPFHFQVYEKTPPPRPQETIAEFCERQSIPYLDALPSLKTMRGKGFHDRNHLSKEGAAVAAEAIRETGWFPRCDPGNRSENSYNGSKSE